MNLPGHPILTCDEARDLEANLFANDEAKEWSAIQRAGRAVADAVLRDFAEIGGFPQNGRVLVLVGKGHNGGDALIATQRILEKFPNAHAEILFVFGERSLRPLAKRAWQSLAHAASVRIEAARLEERNRFELCLDGVFGFQFRAPAEKRVVELLETVNALPIRVRAAVDLPSAEIFRADFTYATGSVKEPVIAGASRAGRVRYLDLGFFRGEEPGKDRVLTADLLASLAGLRAPLSDKRTYGHVFVVAGSRSFPGAALMTTLAALRSGAGLVTAFVPESVAPAFAARAPEAMWVGCPETPSGGIALEGEHLLRERLDRASSLVLGPGLGREPETQALARSIVESSRVPLVIDADALQPEIVNAGNAPRILTPHAGEMTRISGGATTPDFLSRSEVVTVLKGPVTRVLHREMVGHSFFGGPVLARGGSGDLLSGLIAGLLAQKAKDPLLAACRGVVWHGLAADLLARTHGQASVQITQLLDFLSDALRESANGP